MAVYAIGDVQGCYDELCRLLDRLQFDPPRDRLWFTGDLVNRGPKSAATLRFVRSLGDTAITVLGNHDLHLLALAQSQEPRKRKDTLTDVLEAPDREQLLTWLRHQPLMHTDDSLGWVLVHAGLLPQWARAQAQNLAQEVEWVLRGPSYADFFPHMYGDTPNQWHDDIDGWDRIRLITNVFTRLRYCDRHGRAAFHEKRGPDEVSPPLLPWFRVPGRANADMRILFGHWSTLGLHREDNVLGLDTGCLWGGDLTAVRLDQADAPTVSIPCQAKQKLK